MNSFWCEGCDSQQTGIPYIGWDGRKDGLASYICRECAMKSRWIYLESPDGDILIDSAEPKLWGE